MQRGDSEEYRYWETDMQTQADMQLHQTDNKTAGESNKLDKKLGRQAREGRGRQAGSQRKQKGLSCHCTCRHMKVEEDGKAGT
jgi:hypothetical protein